MSKQTLGELIAEALAGGEPRIDDVIAPTPPPMVRTDTSSDWDGVLRIFAEARENDPAKNGASWFRHGMFAFRMPSSINTRRWRGN